MATTEKYTIEQVEEFYEWNSDMSVLDLISWVIELLPQKKFDDFMADIKAALHEEDE